MRCFGPLYGSNIRRKNGRDVTKHIQNQDLGHTLRSRRIFGGGFGKMPKKGSEST